MKELDFNDHSHPSVCLELDNHKHPLPTNRAVRREYKYREIEARLEERRLQRELESFGCE